MWFTVADPSVEPNGWANSGPPVCGAPDGLPRRGSRPDCRRKQSCTFSRPGRRKGRREVRDVLSHVRGRGNWELDAQVDGAYSPSVSDFCLKWRRCFHLRHDGEPGRSPRGLSPFHFRDPNDLPRSRDSFRRRFRGWLIVLAGEQQCTSAIRLQWWIQPFNKTCWISDPAPPSPRILWKIMLRCISLIYFCDLQVGAHKGADCCLHCRVLDLAQRFPNWVRWEIVPQYCPLSARVRARIYLWPFGPPVLLVC